ncbi:MAG: 2-amino-4-hydroxy-6-hydroxymethyldihydropteridine diphosphokinase [Alphaproteobacteria bacterium]|nr:2-amino-4-hydroxy-6-hydroxymethyldihydropteridine diphosphokinase [Alphaproteobacteria bacterium]
MIIIGLGANLDFKGHSPEETLRLCLKHFEENGIKIISVSSIWKSAPVPASDQPWYRNAVCSVSTIYTPSQLLKKLHEIELSFGRMRHEINAARTLDLDIIAYDDRISGEDPILPHPRFHDRAFVLYPLQEIAPDWVHPVTGQSVSDMIDRMPSQQIERCEKLCA